MLMSKIFVSAVLMFGSIAYGKTYTCMEAQTAILGWDNDSNDFKLDDESKPKKPLQIKIILSDKKNTLIVGSDRVALTRVGENSYTEETPNGNINLWRILSEKKTKIFALKAYESAAPLGVMSAYNCE